MKYFSKLAGLLNSIHWDGDGFWAEFQDRALRRIGLDGSLSPLVRFERDAIHQGATSYQPAQTSLTFPAPDEIRYGGDTIGYVRFARPASANPAQPILVGSSEDRYECLEAGDTDPILKLLIDQKRFIRQEVDRLTEKGAGQALVELAGKLEGRAQELIWRNELRFRFIHQNHVIEEEAFFDLLVEKGWRGTHIGLHHLLRAYLRSVKAGEGYQPWCNPDEGVGSLGYALRAYAMLVINPYPLWREYMMKRDGEHECYAGRTLYLEYLKRFGWRDEDDIRFGIFIINNLQWGGYCIRWNDYGLIDAAGSLLSAERFAGLVRQELAEFDLNPQWDHMDGAGYYLRDFTNSLDRSNPFQKRVFQILEPALNNA